MTTQHPTPNTQHPAPRIAAVGLASWDRLLVLDHYPKPGEYRIVRHEASTPGGTTTNTAIALARLGASVRVAALVGDDAHGAAIRADLGREGVDTGWLATRPNEPTDASTIIVSRDPLDRTILWHQGAQIRRGDRLDIPALFGHDLVLVDVADAPLRRFLVDLPAHTLPATRLLGTLTYLVDAGVEDAFDLALRHDVIVGNEREILALTGTWTIADAVAALQSRMPGHALRAAVVSRGSLGCRLLTATDRWNVPAFAVDVVDPTGAGDAFTAGVAYGLALRWDFPAIGRFANALGALATRAYGAQTSLPTMPDVLALMTAQPPNAPSTP